MENERLTCIFSRCRQNLKFEDLKYMEMVMKLEKFLSFVFFFAILALTMRKPHPFVQNAANQKFRLIHSKRGQKIVHGHGQVDMKRDVTVLTFEVL